MNKIILGPDGNNRPSPKIKLKEVFINFLYTGTLALSAKRMIILPLLFLAFSSFINLYGEAEESECGCSRFQVIEDEIDKVVNISEVTLIEGYCLDVRGTLVIDEETDWENLRVLMRVGSVIIVEAPFTIKNCVITNCGDLWMGIYTTEGVSLQVTGSTIEGAEYGIRLANLTQFYCKDVDFVSDFIGISVGSPLEGDNDLIRISQGSEITGCNFYTDGSLPDPYPGQYYYPDWPVPQGGVEFHQGFAAVYMENSIGLTLGSRVAEGSDRNEVYDSRNGVIMINSDSYIVGTDFHDFEGRFPDGLMHIGLLETNQVGIYSERSQATIENNEMEDIFVGVWGKESSDYINNNEIHVYNEPGGILTTKGIHEQTPQNLVAIDNQVYNGYAGIWLQNGTRPFQIKSNYLQRHVHKVNNEGIRIDGYHVLGTVLGLIYDNTLDLDDSRSVVGISLQSATGVKVDNNEINFDATNYAGKHNVGILAFDATSCIISKNDVTADPEYNTSESNMDSINVAIVDLNSSMNHLGCNEMENFDKDLFIVGTNNKTDLSSNFFYDATNGLELYSPCRIGIQDQRGNEWLGDYDGYGAYISGDDPENTAKFCRFLIDQTDDGGIYRPATIGPHVIENNEWFLNTPGTARTCLLSTDQVSPTGVGLSKFIREPIDFESYNDEMTWMAYANLYDLVLKHDSLLAYYAIDSFFSIQELEVLGSLMQVRDNLTRIPDEQITAKLGLETTLRRLTGNLIIIDSIITLDPVDKVDWIDLRVLKNDTIADSLAVWLDILSIEESDFLDACDNALDDLGGITPGNDLEYYLQVVLLLKANALLGNSFSIGDSNKMLLIHDLCPWQGGYALGMDYNVFTYDVDSLPGHNIYDCVAPEPFIRSDKSHTSSKELLNVFPNPSKDFITIKTDLPMLEVTLFDLNSKILKRYTPFNNSFQLNVENLSPGVYLLNVNLRDGIHPVKIVINP